MTEIKAQATKEMNRRFPQVEFNYRNAIVGNAIAIGKKDKLTADWVRKALLSDVEDGFMTYAQAVAVQDDYLKAIENVKGMF